MASRTFNLAHVQIVLWSVLYALMLIYSTRQGEMFAVGVASSTLNLTFGAIAIYVQALYLIPQYFEHGRGNTYMALSFIIMLVLVTLRVGADFMILNRQFGLVHFYNLSPSHIAFVFLTIILCSFVGFLLRMTMNHITLLKKQQELSEQQSATELKLLKAQIQPHFMFNTLNNIYSLAHKGSEKTAEMVAKLSDIMRYFVHEAGKDSVPLQLEIDFIRNYIDLEMIRMVNPPMLKMEVNVTNVTSSIPPMLFIPFVENYFKHGVDKTREGLPLTISFTQGDTTLTFAMKNEVPAAPKEHKSGVGLENIRRRLEIIYGKNYTLHVNEDAGFFAVRLTIPFHT